MRIAYFCMESEFSVLPLEALIAAGVDVGFVMRPVGGLLGRSETVLRKDRPLARPMSHLAKLRQRNPEPGSHDPFDVARAHNIPCWCVGDASSRLVQDLLARERIDLIVIAFFNQLLRPNILAAVPLGAVNAHPSLLPAYRGPSPLFWTFRDAVEKTGVTVHRVFDGEDDGDVLSQVEVEVPVGMRGEDLVHSLSDVAAREITRVVTTLLAGEKIASSPQAGTCSKAPRPRPRDLEVDSAFGAKRLFSFARGVGRWNSLTVKVGDERFRVVDGVDYSDEKRVPGEYAQMGETLLLGCDDGTVVLQVVT